MQVLIAEDEAISRLKLQKQREQWGLQSLKGMEQAAREMVVSDAGEVMRRSPLFAHVGASAMADVEAESELVQLSKGTPLFVRGDLGDSMYVLVRGTLRVTTTDAEGAEIVLDILEPGATVGEMALLTGQPRTATVCAIDDAALLRLSKAGFDRLAVHHPEAMTSFARTIIPRWQRVQLVDALGAVFGPLDADIVRDVHAALEWQHLARGEVLFRQGQPGDAMFIVVNGRLRIEVEHSAGGKEVVGEVGRGETVGEFAMLTGDPRSATASAIRDTDLVKLTEPVFERLVAKHPEVMRRIARMIVKRTQRGLPTRTGETPAVSFALVPINPATPIDGFARTLSTTLAAFGSTLHLSSTHVDRDYGKRGAAQTEAGDPAEIGFAGWLTHMEQQHQYLIYEADSTWTPWTQRCLRQADRILLIGQAGGDPGVGEIETALESTGVTVATELVLLQPESTLRPAGTQRWLERRRVDAHHHVRVGNSGDVQHVARMLAGRAVGLVLSGGGARGYAHIGVIRALIEAGIDVDVIGGTSMGAVIGAGLAIDMEYPRIVELAKTFGSSKKLYDRTLPIASLMASGKMTALLLDVFEEIRIEDLWRPFFCVSSNLTRAEPMVHREGYLWEALRASSAVPGLFAPFLYNGDVLVDGGVMNNFPVDIMRKVVEQGTVIGCHAGALPAKMRNYDFGPSISGWKILWSKLNPFVRSVRVPSLATTLLRSVEINTVYHLPSLQHYADVLIQPPVETFPVFDFSRYDDLIDIGYHAAREPLIAWKRSELRRRGSVSGAIDTRS